MADDDQPGPSGGTIYQIKNLTNSVVIQGDHNSVINIPAQPTPKIWFNVQEPIVSFFERKNFLPKLHQSLHDNEVEGTVLSRLKIIFGLGGIGKTQMARKYVQVYKTEYYHVVWINAESKNSMVTSFSKLAQHLKIPLTDPNNGGKDRELDDIVKDCYEIICLKKSLLVFDNAEFYEDKSFKNGNGIKPFLPGSLSSDLAPPFVLITTRNRDWVALSRHVVFMELFDDTECIHFILGQLPSEKGNEEDASKLGRMLGGLILALQQAVAFIREEDEDRLWSLSSFGVKGYLEAFGRKKQKFLNYSPLDADYGATVATTWRMTLDKIQESDEDGQLVNKICEIVSFLSPDGVPIKFLMDLLKEINRSQVGKCLRQLNRYALIEMSKDSTTITMHRLVQHVILEIVKETGRVESILDGLVEICSELVQNLGYNFETCSDLLNNFRSIADKFELVPKPKQEFVSFGDLLGRRYQEMGKYREALETYQHLFQILRKHVNPEHPDVLAVQNNMAVVLERQGKYNEAFEMYDTVLEIRKKILSPEHPSLLTTQNNLASVLKNLGRDQEALEMYEAVLEIRKKISSSEHPSLLTTQNNLALVLQKLGRDQEALEMYEAVLEIRKKIVSPEHPDLLATQNHLASVLQKMGRDQEALEMYEAVLEIRKKIQSPEHPDLLGTQNNLAVVLQKLGRDQEALEMCETVLKIRKKILSPDHPDLLTTQNNLALVLEKLGRDQEALEMYEAVLEIEKKILSPEHPSLLTTQNNLALVLQTAGRDQEALEMYEAVLEIEKKILSSEHPDLLATQNNLASVLQKMGRDQEALEMYEAVLEIRNKIQSPEHPDLLTTQNHLASVLQKMGRDQESLEMYQTVLKIRKKILSPEHPDLLGTQNNLAIVLHKLGRHREAMDFMKNVVEIWTKTLTADHPVLLASRECLSILHALVKE